MNTCGQEGQHRRNKYIYRSTSILLIVILLGNISQRECVHLPVRVAYVTCSEEGQSPHALLKILLLLLLCYDNRLHKSKRGAQATQTSKKKISSDAIRIQLILLTTFAKNSVRLVGDFYLRRADKLSAVTNTQVGPRCARPVSVECSMRVTQASKAAYSSWRGTKLTTSKLYAHYVIPATLLSCTPIIMFLFLYFSITSLRRNGIFTQNWKPTRTCIYVRLRLYSPVVSLLSTEMVEFFDWLVVICGTLIIMAW